MQICFGQNNIPKIRLLTMASFSNKSSTLDSSQDLVRTKAATFQHSGNFFLLNTQPKNLRVIFDSFLSYLTYNL